MDGTASKALYRRGLTLASRRSPVVLLLALALPLPCPESHPLPGSDLPTQPLAMSKEAPPAAAAAEETPARKSSVVPMIAAVVAGLAVGGGAGAFVVGPALAAGIAPAAAAPKIAHADGEEAEEGGEEADAAEGDAAAEPGAEGGVAGASPVHVIDNLVLNPAASGGTRFLLLTIAFEMKSPALVEALKARDAEVRDHVLNIVGAKSVEQLAEMATREALKGELADDLAKLLNKKKAVKKIYFPQFVIQ